MPTAIAGPAVVRGADRIRPAAAPRDRCRRRRSAVPVTPSAPAARLRAGMGQVRLLWGALALVAAALLAVILLRTGPIGDPTITAAQPQDRRRQWRRPMPARRTMRFRRSASWPRATIRPSTASPRQFRAAFAGFDTLRLIGGEFRRASTGCPTDPTGFVLSLADGPIRAACRSTCRTSAPARCCSTACCRPSETDAEAIEDEVASIATARRPGHRRDLRLSRAGRPDSRASSNA